PGVLSFHMAAVMLQIIHPFDFFKAVIRLIRVVPECVGCKASIAVPIHILSNPFRVDVFTVPYIKPAVIVAGVVGAMLSRTTIVSRQLQAESLLSSENLDAGRAAKPQTPPVSAAGNTQYNLTQASSFPGPRFSTSGHRSKGSPPLRSAQGAAAPVPRHKGIASLCTPAPAKPAAAGSAGSASSHWASAGYRV